MKLEIWLSEKKGFVKRKDFALSIGVKPSTLTGYCRGDFRPSLVVADRIARVTSGKVTPRDFISELVSEAAE